MYLIDTNVISELRKNTRANPGVLDFFDQLQRSPNKSYLSVITMGELRRGIELCRYRGDKHQAKVLEQWLNTLVEDFSATILPFTLECAQVWGYLTVPDPAHILDKQIAATALVFDLTLVTRNESDFLGTGVRLHNPFTP
jgi:predicted nucleic acid-binding protein